MNALKPPTPIDFLDKYGIFLLNSRSVHGGVRRGGPMRNPFNPLDRRYKLGPSIFFRLNPVYWVCLMGEGFVQAVQSLYGFLKGENEKDNYL